MPGLVPGLAACLTILAGCGDDTTPPAADSGTASPPTSTDGESTATPDATGEGTSTTAAVDSTGSTTGAEPGCWTDLRPGQTEVLYQGFDDGSEGIAFGADGQLYATTNVAGDGTVWRIDAAGMVTEHAAVPYALGLAGLADGSFVVASIGVNNMPDGAIYVVDPAGRATQLATGIDSPNFVTIAPDGSALVSDDFDTRVFRVALTGPEAGDVTVAIADVPSPNGMAYGPAGDVLYVASTFSPDGQLTRYEVDDAGMPIEASAIEILHLGPGSTPDGIAVDALGWVYVAANLFGEIWRVDGSATELVEGELVAEGLGSPASLAFGRGEGFDPCSVYVTQLFADRIYRVAIGVEGAPLYE